MCPGLGLYMDLTVAENLRFYAATFGIEASPADLPDALAQVKDPSWARSGWVASASSPSHAH